MNQSTLCLELDRDSVPIAVPGVLANEVRIILTPILLLIWLVAAMANILLWMFLKQVKTHSTQYIKAVIISCLPVLLLGMPIEIIQVATDYAATSHLVCVITAKSVYIFLFMSKLLILYFIAAFNLQRYCHVTQSRFNRIATKTSVVIPGLTIFVLAINVPIIYQLAQKNRTDGKCLMRRGCHYECELLCPLIMRYITVVITTSMSLCSIIITITVTLLRIFIKHRDNEASRVLGHTRITNKARVNAATAIWIAFSMAWIPSAFSNGPLLTNLTERQFHNTDAGLRTLAYTSFLTLPTIYYYMDRNYALYVQKTLTKVRQLKKQGTVTPQDVQQPTHAHNQTKTVSVRQINVASC